ncbi:MAG: Hsp20/alpha crystallin family protein [Alphaproteobacteria bacterium]|nr:Hsp20/alpha crystallin family protein [Alphaproteobacteria bacterium]
MSIRELVHFDRPCLSVRRGVNPLFSLQDEINQLFSGFLGNDLPAAWRPAEPTMVTPLMDVRETEKEITVTAEIPGLKIEDMDISITHNYLTLKGEKREEKTEGEEGSSYYRRERSYGAFQRAVALPDTADTEKAKAEIRDGVLTVTVPKKQAASGKTRKLEVKAA